MEKIGKSDNAYGIINVCVWANLQRGFCMKDGLFW